MRGLPIVLDRLKAAAHLLLSLSSKPNASGGLARISVTSWTEYQAPPSDLALSGKSPAAPRALSVCSSRLDPRTGEVTITTLAPAGSRYLSWATLLANAHAPVQHAHSGPNRLLLGLFP